MKLTFQEHFIAWSVHIVAKMYIKVRGSSEKSTLVVQDHISDSMLVNPHY